MSSREDFDFTWTIENFNKFLQEDGGKIESSVYRVNRFYNTSWYLSLHPKGDDGETASCVAYLIRIFDDGPEEINVDFEISINSVSKKARHCFVKLGSFRFADAVSWPEKIRHGKDCVIVCRMSLCKDGYEEIQESTSNLIVLPSYWEPESLPLEIQDELILATGKQVQELRESLWLYPEQCFARTRILVEERSVTCPVKTIATLGKMKQLHLTASACWEIPDLFICLKKIMNNELEDLEIKVCFTDELVQDVFVVCEVQVAHPTDGTCSAGKSSQSFEKSKVPSIWKLDDNFMWSEVKKQENSKFKFKFSLSFGSTFSNIEYVGEVDYFTTKTSDRLGYRMLSDGLFLQYKEKKFCDVVLHTSDGILETHKAVLCAVSPVFSAMFQSGMEESDTNAIHIKDLNSDIVNQMLTFLFTGRIDGQGWDRFSNLYFAADKYQISSLKQVCRYYLKKNLSVENVCSVLLLADAHGDTELKESVAFFFSVHKWFIFQTEQWNHLSESNAKLGLEILQKVCSEYL